MRRVIGLGILLVGMSVTTEGVMEVEEPVTVVDGDHLNVVFTVPDATSWSWKLTATAGSGWRHIDGTQTPSSGDWVPDAFSGNPGYWKSATVDDNSPWRNFQQPFHGKLSPVGEGEGPGEPYIGEYDIDAVTDSEYFVLPTLSYVCAGEEVTLTAYSEPMQDPDNPPPTVNSTWEINKTDGITPDPFPDGHSVTFTASEPDTYTVKGASTSDSDLTDSAQVNVVKIELEAKDTSTTAEGTRKSDSTLVMVKEGTTARGATMTLSVDGVSLPSGRPTWSGTDITGDAGSLTATYSGTSDSTGTAHTGLSDCDQTISITIVDESKLTLDLDFNEGYLKDLMDKVKDALETITGSDSVADVNGAISGTIKYVDAYNDGEDYGIYVNVSSDLTASFEGISFSSPSTPVPALPAVTMKFTASVTDISAGVTASGTYDESKAAAGNITGSVNASASVGVGAVAAVVGEVVKISLSGSTTLSADASVALNVAGKSCTVDASGTLSNSDLVASYKVEASVFGVDWTVSEGSYPFPDTANSVNVSGTIATFGGE